MFPQETAPCQQTTLVSLSFPDLSPAEASILAQELATALAEAGVPRGDISRRRTSADAQDMRAVIMVAAGAYLFELAKEAGKEFAKGAARNAGSRTVDAIQRKWGTRAEARKSYGETIIIRLAARARGSLAHARSGADAVEHARRRSARRSDHRLREWGRDDQDSGRREREGSCGRCKGIEAGFGASLFRRTGGRSFREAPTPRSSSGTLRAGLRWRRWEGIQRTRQFYVGMSTHFGKTAIDGVGGMGSPFAPAFIEQMTMPGLRIDDAFRALRKEASRKTDGKREPEILQDDLEQGALVLVRSP